MRTSRFKGFSLLELMVVLAILSILVSMAVPGFQQHVQSTRRDDARHLLLLNAQRLQRCFTLAGVYNGGCVTRNTSNDGYYSLTATSTAYTFSLSARPVAGSSQANDTGCTSFGYDHTGKQTATGSDSDHCWK